MTLRDVRTLMASMLLLIAFSANSQTKASAVKPITNSYGVTKDVWRTYLNKTNLYLEKVDEMSFLNYIFFSHDADFADILLFSSVSIDL